MISLSGLYGERENLRQGITLYNFEKYIQYLFVKKANELGFVVHNSESIINIGQIFNPNLSAFIQDESSLKEQNVIDFNSVDQPEMYVCQAQHHGIPTRLLDFTVNPYAALFFASDASKNDDVDEIAVFATNLNSFRYIKNQTAYYTI